MQEGAGRLESGLHPVDMDGDLEARGIDLCDLGEREGHGAEPHPWLGSAQDVMQKPHKAGPRGPRGRGGRPLPSGTRGRRRQAPGTAVKGNEQL